MRCDSGRRAALRSVRAQLQPVPGSEGEPGPDSATAYPDALGDRLAGAGGTSAHEVGGR